MKIRKKRNKSMDNENINEFDTADEIYESGISIAKRVYFRSRLKKKPGNRDSPHASKLQGSKYKAPRTESVFATDTVSTAHEAQKNLMKKEIQLQAIKERASETAKASGGFMRKISDKVDDVAGRIADKMADFIKEHPLGTIIALVIMLIIMVVSGALSSCSVMFSGVNDAVITTSFTADDRDIIAVELVAVVELPAAVGIPTDRLLPCIVGSSSISSCQVCGTGSSSSSSTSLR